MKKYIGEFVKKPLPVTVCQTDEPITVHTMEGLVTAKAGDYILSDVDGHEWPVNKNIFEERYERIK